MALADSRAMTPAPVATLTSAGKGARPAPGGASINRHFHPILETFAPLIVVAAGTLAIWLSGPMWANQNSVLAMLSKWTPLLLRGFAVDIALLSGSIFVGTAAGLLLGLALLSRNRAIRASLMLLVQLLRNSPGLVVLFFVVFALPFRLEIFGIVVPFPGWAKVIFSFSIKISANVAECVRGSALSISKGQWQAGSALGLTHRQIFWNIIFPQCIPIMTPPWLNVVAIFLAAVPTASLVGIYDAVSYAELAIKAEQTFELILPIYLYIISWFFAVGYALHEFTTWREKQKK
jgi:polar amino acid transport system permease protein